jgi:hypothetical protein
VQLAALHFLGHETGRNSRLVSVWQQPRIILGVSAESLAYGLIRNGEITLISALLRHYGDAAAIGM